MKDVNLDALERLAEEKRGRASMSVTPRQILSLIAHIRELEQDAARYRFQRANAVESAGITADQWDALVDAAMPPSNGAKA
ncbi:hypothetical protein [Cupriavidus gilardii]|uniref:CopG family transcriptional regulator n=1 Tax=Cupriavidus gilardii TaxID=82541 RepID=A0A849BIX1_9BURK|nr:hypothetical protein [Cupriavidus gilardii]KAB0597751.1 hypothetical protein F7Q96_07465 [Cupriavidus gilardii]NNH14054.1 hypothetical protein [Cupriavidus gilardii]WNG71725.1 hypothetical protein QWJ31_16575 [Cupriavidus gilardii]